MIGDTSYRLTKSWENPDDFSTYEESEEQVRADMQCLFTELLNALNDLVGAISAGNIPFTGQSGIPDGSVATAMAYVLAQAQAAVQASIPDGSISTAKLADSAVSTAKIADSAVTNAKIAGMDASKLTGSLPAGIGFTVTESNLQNAAVSADKIAAGAVGQAKLADSAVGNAKLASNAVSTAKIADSAVTDAKIAGVSGSKVSGAVAEATAAATAAKLGTSAGSATKPVYFSNGVPVACTYEVKKEVPADAKFTDTTYSAAAASTLGLVRMSYGTGDPPTATAAGQLYFKLVD